MQTLKKQNKIYFTMNFVQMPGLVRLECNLKMVLVSICGRICSSFTVSTGTQCTHQY